MTCFLILKFFLGCPKNNTTFLTPYGFQGPNSGHYMSDHRVTAFILLTFYHVPSYKLNDLS